MCEEGKVCVSISAPVIMGLFLWRKKVAEPPGRRWT